MEPWAMLPVLVVGLALVFAAGRPWGRRPRVQLAAGISLLLTVSAWATFGYLQ